MDVSSTTRKNGFKTSSSSNFNFEEKNDKDGSNVNANRRDGPLTQKLIVAENTKTSSNMNNSHYKNSPSSFDEQEQFSPDPEVWGFVPSPTNEENSPENKEILDEPKTSSLMAIIAETRRIDDEKSDDDELLDKPRIVIKKIKFNDPNHYPEDLSPEMIEEFVREKHGESTEIRSLRRKRRVNYENLDGEPEEEEETRKRVRHDPIAALNRKTRDRLARKALEIDADPQANRSFQRFVELLNVFFEDCSRYESEICGKIDDSHLDLLLPGEILEEMSSLSEKLKLTGYMCRIDENKLKKLVELVSMRIKQGIELNPMLKKEENLDEENEDEENWRNSIFERLSICADACELTLNVMTAAKMPKEILSEQSIEKVSLFVKNQLSKTIFPSFDPIYRNENSSKDFQLAKQKRSKSTSTKCKIVQNFYNKIVSSFQSLNDLIILGKFSDTIILSISSLAVGSFFVENIFDLQAHSLNILGEIFSRYDDHRDSILDDLLLSIVRLPTSKKSLRRYRLASGEFIQMFTALILTLVQSVVNIRNQQTNDIFNEIDLLSNYAHAQKIAFRFLTLFFRSFGTKHSEDDYRIIFENFLADLLLTSNRAEWPASEILLTLLSRILMKNFSDNSLPIPLRLQSLDYLGSVAAQLRRDTIDLHVLNSRFNQKRLENLLEQMLNSLEIEDSHKEIYRTDSLRYHRILLIYLNELSQYETTNRFAKLFHFGQWIRDLNLTIDRLTQMLTRRQNPNRTTQLVDEHFSYSLDQTQSKAGPSSISDEIERKKVEKTNLMKLLTLPVGRSQTGRYLFDVDYDDICLLMRYLTSNRPFLKTFDVYLKQLAAIFQSEAGNNLRSKAMKCLCTVVEADPSVLARNDIKTCVQVGLTDKSISVREAAIDLIGRYVVQKQQLILQYYDVLCERSIDTGVSVRKRVLKIFRDICLTQSDFIRIPDICARFLRRLNDEESIRKFVLDTFQQLWFTPTGEKMEIRRRVQIIIDVLIDGQKQNNTWLENLVKQYLFVNEKLSNEEKKKLHEQHQGILKSIQCLIDELIESILKIESGNDQVSSNKLVATFVAVHALGKAEPRHVLPHFSTIVEYLNIKCTSYNDNLIVQYVAKILEFTVPLMKSASASVIYSLEGSLTKLLLVSGQLVIHSSIACLSAAVRLSKNTSLVKEVFRRYHAFVQKARQQSIQTAQVARSIYILGVLSKYFDFERDEYQDLKFSVDDLFQLFLIFLGKSDSMIKLKSLVALGFFLQRYGRFLVEDPIKKLYNDYLLDRSLAGAQLRCQVLINLEDYFRDCIRRMAEYDVDYLKVNESRNEENLLGTGENLRDTSDVHSEMASSIAQCYLRIVLETYLSDDEIIRQCVRKVVTSILEQGLVHPVQFIPYLIAMTTDHDLNIQQTAEQNLQQLDKTHPGIIQTKVIQGLKMSFELQKLLNKSKNRQNSEIIRGMSKLNVISYSQQQSPFCSVNHFLYSLIRSSRVYRRAFICQLLKMFENDDGNNQLTLEEQLFVADNLAYFPYQVQDEPLYLVEQIDLTVSVNGSTLLQQLREMLKKSFRYVDDEEGVDVKKLEEKISQAAPEKIDEFQEVLRCSKPTLLLLLLKSYLKDVYSLNETKIIEYDHTESSKILDRPIVNRKLNVEFDGKLIIETIQKSAKIDDGNQRNQCLVREFADFKRYLLSFDGDADEFLHSIAELLPNANGGKTNRKRTSNSSKRRKVMVDSDDEETFSKAL